MVQDVSAIQWENTTTSWNGDGWEQTRILELSMKRISHDLDGTILFHEDFGRKGGNLVYNNVDGNNKTKAEMIEK